MGKDTKTKKNVIASVIIILGILVLYIESVEAILDRDDIIVLDESKYNEKYRFHLAKDEIKREDYRKTKNYITFIKNFSYWKGSFPTSSDIIVMESKCIVPLNQAKLFNFILYPAESKDTGVSGEECSEVENTQPTRMRSILSIPLRLSTRRGLSEKLYSIKRINSTLSRFGNFGSVFKCVNALLSRNVYNEYAYWIGESKENIGRGLKDFSNALEKSNIDCSFFEKFGLEETVAYKLAHQAEISQRRLFYGTFSNYLLNMFGPELEDILRESRRSSLKDMDSIEEVDRKFEEEAELISSRIESSCNRHNSTENMKKLTRMYIEDSIFYICALVSTEVSSYIKDFLHEKIQRIDRREVIKAELSEWMECVVKEEVEPWNAELFRLACETIIDLYGFDGTFDEMVKMIRKRNIRILKKLSLERHKKYEEYIRLVSLKEEYIENIRLIGEFIKMLDAIIHSTNCSESERIRMIQEEEEVIVPEIISALAECINYGTKEENIRYIKSILASMVEEYVKCGLLDLDAIAAKKKDLVDSIIGIPDEYISGCKGMLKMEAVIKPALSKIINMLIPMELESAVSRNYGLIEAEIKEEEKYFTEKDLDKSFPLIVKLYNDYNKILYTCCSSYITNEYSIVYPDMFLKEEDIPFFKDMEMALRGKIMHKWIERNRHKRNMCRIARIYRNLYHIHKHITILESYAEIWDNPVFLTIDVSSGSGSQGEIPRSIEITYESPLNRKIVTETIEYTDKTMLIFRNAKTMADVLSMCRSTRNR